VAFVPSLPLTLLPGAIFLLVCCDTVSTGSTLVPSAQAHFMRHRVKECCRPICTRFGECHRILRHSDNNGTDLRY
jgi:hypothetical protein